MQGRVPEDEASSTRIKLVLFSLSSPVPLDTGLFFSFLAPVGGGEAGKGTPINAVWGAAAGWRGCGKGGDGDVDILIGDGAWPTVFLFSFLDSLVSFIFPSELDERPAALLVPTLTPLPDQWPVPELLVRSMKLDSWLVSTSFNNSLRLSLSIDLGNGSHANSHPKNRFGEEGSDPRFEMYAAGSSKGFFLEWFGAKAGTGGSGGATLDRLDILLVDTLLLDFPSPYPYPCP